MEALQPKFSALAEVVGGIAEGALHANPIEHVLTKPS